LEYINNKIIKNIDEIKFIEKSTTLQSEYELCYKERKIRLTASNFGKICKLLPSTFGANTVISISYKTFYANEHTRYGNECEPIAKAKFEQTRARYLGGYIIIRVKGIKASRESSTKAPSSYSCIFAYLSLFFSLDFLLCVIDPLSSH
jgi:hypothetical protein